MRIVIDTNVFISGVFFGGYPRKVLDAIIKRKIDAFASPEIIEEYRIIVEEMISRKQGKLNPRFITPFIQRLHVIMPESDIEICRDPDDNKFLECAKDSKALYIVSGDKDLLVLV